MYDSHVVKVLEVIIIETLNLHVASEKSNSPQDAFLPLEDSNLQIHCWLLCLSEADPYWALLLLWNIVAMVERAHRVFWSRHRFHLWRARPVFARYLRRMASFHATHVPVKPRAQPRLIRIAASEQTNDLLSSGLQSRVNWQPGKN